MKWIDAICYNKSEYLHRRTLRIRGWTRTCIRAAACRGKCKVADTRRLWEGENSTVHQRFTCTPSASTFVCGTIAWEKLFLRGQNSLLRDSKWSIIIWLCECRYEEPINHSSFKTTLYQLPLPRCTYQGELLWALFPATWWLRYY